MSSCTNPNGRIVTPEYLAQFEGCGSLSTLWYQGSDKDFHYFRHLNKTSTPYRIRRTDMPSSNEFELGKQELEKRNSMVRREFSDFIKSEKSE